MKNMHEDKIESIINCIDAHVNVPVPGVTRAQAIADASKIIQ
jgi:hypothetical protein